MNATPTVLIVDDEADLRELVEITLSRMGIRSAAAANLAEARSMLARQRFDLCITDMRLPDGSGISLVQHIQQQHPQLPVAVLTAYGNAQAAVESLKAGAFDFVSKPIDLHMLRKLVDTALRLKAAPGPAADEGPLLGQAASIVALRGMIERLARSQAPVHIAGESGSGKELVARLIHQRGPRAAGPFVPVNCGAIPNELMESEFFGHLKGSFTGAARDKAGLFQAAEGGTLFLDEVADLPLHMQVKLLRALQERAVRPVGAEKEVQVNVRVISATHKDLAALAAAGAFRQDLYYRLNVIEVRVPPLRERREDILLLAQKFAQDMARELKHEYFAGFTPAAEAQMQAYDWPGNVRELRNVVERAVYRQESPKRPIERVEFDPFNSPYRLHTAVVPGEPPPAPVEAAAPQPPAAPQFPLDFEQAVAAHEVQLIRAALDDARYNQRKAAQRLSLTYHQFRGLLRKYKLLDEARGA